MGSVFILSKPMAPGNGKDALFWREGTRSGGARWAGEWDDGCPVWVENLNRSEQEISALHPEVREKVQQALEACKKSQEAGEIGLSRLDEHWKTDSHIQRSPSDFPPPHSSPNSLVVMA